MIDRTTADLTADDAAMFTFLVRRLRRYSAEQEACWRNMGRYGWLLHSVTCDRNRVERDIEAFAAETGWRGSVADIPPHEADLCQWKG